MHGASLPCLHPLNPQPLRHAWPPRLAGEGPAAAGGQGVCGAGGRHHALPIQRLSRRTEEMKPYCCTDGARPLPLGAGAMPCAAILSPLLTAVLCCFSLSALLFLQVMMHAPTDCDIGTNVASGVPAALRSDSSGGSGMALSVHGGEKLAVCFFGCIHTTQTPGPQPWRALLSPSRRPVSRLPTSRRLCWAASSC